MKRGVRFFSLTLIFTLTSAIFVLAITTPEGPGTMSVVNSTRRTPTGMSSNEAYAGNITFLTITGQTVTQSWQGYVGNVSGVITLDDADNYTLYDWTDSSPTGEIYATYLSSVDWTTGNVLCWNWSAPEVYLQLNELEGWGTTGVKPTSTKSLGVTQTAVDGVNETFTCNACDGSTLLTHANFYVGGQFINGSALSPASQGGGPCPAVKLYNGTGSGVFQEVILYNNQSGDNNDGVIYTSILNDSINGYNNQSWDFEMIVGENGHSGDTSTTTYYFYVELE